MSWKLPDLILVGVPIQSDPFISSIFSTLIGAILGGVIVITGDFFLKKREQHLELIERDYELYIVLVDVINDVWAISSRYFPALDKHGWPISPWAVMQPAIGETEFSTKIPARLLSTIRSPEGRDLPHKALEMTNFRNIIMVANSQFQDFHTKVIEASAPYTDLSQGLRMSAELDKRNPAHKSVIVHIQRADSLAKQLLTLMLDFNEFVIDFAKHYNRYHSTHRVKKFRALLIDVSGIEAQINQYSRFRDATIET
ncbi:MAG: hypothetical protein CVT79_16740 [Alphaproteobacteria bacterium HGW-Alphaproteobacteria-18]|nr:MAG: hypothetical protein CVT79_16740 [Alphaproteobacteria bacterium HGW-Alphaproteobacteria-18]